MAHIATFKSHCSTGVEPVRVFVAGATGAIGLPLVRCLIARGHLVYGTTRSPVSAEVLSRFGAKPVLVDALDSSAMRDAVCAARPDVVVEQMTSLPRVNTPEARRAAASLHNRIRLVGGANVHNAAIEAGATRYVAQSSAFWCEPGEGLAPESTSLATEVKAPAVSAGARTLFEVESRVLDSKLIEGTVLRYGFFYGPRTWYARDGSTADQVRAREVPLIGSGLGLWSFVHVDDATVATVAAIESNSTGLYNITDDRPVALQEWLPAYAQYLGAPPPPAMSEENARQILGEDAVFYATQLRGASNSKARRDLAFRPRALEWMAPAVPE
ncbi:MAG TPA: NAD(P)-dependent oxidoreductase [Bradyrhizobium sp.]|nr:NAD(P)-dependent oxidoreductase [Bradyrhizobium sp.]